MMDLLERFQQFVKQNDLFQPKDHLLLAVSGGVDSVVLCELCKQVGYDFSIAHCNFRLREKESERDKEFVQQLAKKYDVEFFLKEFDTDEWAAKTKKGIQEAARDLRYKWFLELWSDRSHSNETHEGSTAAGWDVTKNRRWIVTAHHADDNIETVLMNFCRGTGLGGLTGIPAENFHIRRPLLEFWKDELIAFANENHLHFVEDSSNQSSKYTRNLFRNEIIPLISKTYPQVKQNLRDNIDRFSEISKLYELSVATIRKKLMRKKGEEYHIPAKQLLGYHNRALIYEIISPFGFTETHIDEVIKLTGSESGKYIQSPASEFRIIKFRNWLIIAKARSDEKGMMVIEKGMTELEIENPRLSASAGQGKLKIENILLTSDFRLPTSALIACLDGDEIHFPLILRKWKDGDYFYPLGMRKKKKLARFFIDQKLSKTEKEKTWVMEMNKKIIWVVGMRIDDRFKVTDKTKRILQLSLETA
jgi:tRNA(Ile)-lysidine synthase